MTSVSSARERSDRAGGGCGSGEGLFQKLEYKNRISEHLKNTFYGEKQNPKIYVCNNMILNKMIKKL